MADERKPDSKEEVIKDLPKKDEPISSDDLEGVVGGMQKGGIGRGSLPTYTSDSENDVTDT